MKKLFIFLFFIFSINATSVSASEIQTEFIEATIENHLDGDTIDVSINGETKRVKMIGVNAPEIRAVNLPIEFYGKEAVNYTATRLPTNKTIYLETNLNVTDKYGRLLSYIWYQKPETSTPSQIELNQYLHNAKLIANGYAKQDLKNDNPNFHHNYNALLLSLEKTAKNNHWGIWSKPLKNHKAKTTSTKTINKQNNLNPSKNTQGSIKGNINSKGEKIYHLPGQAHYDKTIAEAYFSTESEAQAAGFRRAER